MEGPEPYPNVRIERAAEWGENDGRPPFRGLFITDGVVVDGGVVPARLVSGPGEAGLSAGPRVCREVRGDTLRRS